MNRKIYREIAKKNRISVDEVKREMQAAINEAYANPNPQVMNIPHKNAVPTIEEFVDYSVNEIKRN